MARRKLVLGRQEARSPGGRFTGRIRCLKYGEKVVKLIKTADNGDRQPESLCRTERPGGLKIAGYSGDWRQICTRCAGKAAGEVAALSALWGQPSPPRWLSMVSGGVRVDGRRIAQ
jgi:hypothetical protein